jgi:hypothetical protein
MTDSSIARITGMFGVACVLLSWAQFPLWVIGGAPPFYDSEALARHLYDIRTTAFIRILMDQGIYVSMRPAFAIWCDARDLRVTGSVSWRSCPRRSGWL